MTAEAIAAAATALGLAPDKQQLDRLDRFVDLLARWNETYNLTAVRGREQILSHHIADCLAIVGPLAGRQIEGRVLDVGSGAGLPGVVLAIMRPDLEVTCIDAVGKKAAFVRQVAGALGLSNLRSAHGRVESYDASAFDLITSRAFASLADFVVTTRRLLAPGGWWLAMKGKVPRDEVAHLPVDVELFHVEQLEVPGLAAERCIVWLKARTGPVA